MSTHSDINWLGRKEGKTFPEREERNRRQFAKMCRFMALSGPLLNKSGTIDTLHVMLSLMGIEKGRSHSKSMSQSVTSAGQSDEGKSRWTDAKRNVQMAIKNASF